jgi:hypothetical protein
VRNPAFEFSGSGGAVFALHCPLGMKKVDDAPARAMKTLDIE